MIFFDQSYNIMKTLVKIILLLITCIIALTVSAQKNNKYGFLEITPTVLLNDKHISDYAISIYLDGYRIDSLFISSKKKAKFYVKFDTTYTFLCQKTYCSDKIVIIDTKTSQDLKSKKSNRFNFQVEMLQSLSNKSSDSMDYSVSVIYIDKNKALDESEDFNKNSHLNTE